MSVPSSPTSDAPSPTTRLSSTGRRGEALESGTRVGGHGPPAEGEVAGVGRDLGQQAGLYVHVRCSPQKPPRPAGKGPPGGTNRAARRSPAGWFP